MVCPDFWVAWPQVELLADGNGGFVRMLGFELGIAEGSGPKCQRFAGIVDDGILLKVVRKPGLAFVLQASLRSEIKACCIRGCCICLRCSSSCCS
eukprot:1157109-Pelagomonas_calceolata.AAC.1